MKASFTADLPLLTPFNELFFIFSPCQPLMISSGVYNLLHYFNLFGSSPKSGVDKINALFLIV
ncbi:hypothetical protein, partial [Cytobacillus gottheilii]|uniref:hypothetical protein n=1 Tax=Cytobacillus gottheilii TaxID=859144 RepID=UPI0034639D7D